MSLLRYPGGKSRYTKFILPALHRCFGFSTYVEPFIGGGSVALAMAARYPNVRLILNDLDPGIAALWDLIANAPTADFDSFTDRVLGTEPSVKLFNQILESKPIDRMGRAFRALFLNRTSYGGMGWRPLGGQNQESEGKIDSRWSASRRVAELHAARDLLHGRTQILNADFANVIPLAGGTSLMFLDPPYYHAGNELYNFHWTDADHERLREALLGKNNWVMSYDDHPFIRNLYLTLAYSMAVKYSGGKNRTETHELLLSPRLEFLPDSNPEVGLKGVSDGLRIWIKGAGPND